MRINIKLSGRLFGKGLELPPSDEAAREFCDWKVCMMLAGFPPGFVAVTDLMQILYSLMFHQNHKAGVRLSLLIVRTSGGHLDLGKVSFAVEQYEP